jgi:hypothetical protein
MKTKFAASLSLLLSPLCVGGSYTNFIRQVQIPSGVQWDAAVAASGQTNSPLPIDTSGARFELWTVLSSPLTSYLLDTRYVSSYAPSAEVVITSEDPYTLIPRTRADRPFTVEVNVSNLLSDPSAPDAAKSVQFLRHVQSYGENGTGENLDRTQATLQSQGLITSNGKQKFEFPLTVIPGADRTKVRGEERFSVFTVADSSAPAAQLSSRYVQVWPVTTAQIAGISMNQKFRLQMPKLTITYDDLYPDSQTYVQVYKGEKQDDAKGTMVKASWVPGNGSVSEDRVILLNGSDYEAAFNGDGRWTMEVVTITPFGKERLAYVSFDVDRTIELNGTFSTIE